MTNQTKPIHQSPYTILASIRMCDITLQYVTCLIQILTDSLIIHILANFRLLTDSLIHTFDITHSNVWQDSCIYWTNPVYWSNLIFMYTVAKWTAAWSWRGANPGYSSWRIYVCDTTSYADLIPISLPTNVCLSLCLYVYVYIYTLNSNWLLLLQSATYNI